MNREVTSYYDRYWSEGGFRPPPNSNSFIDEHAKRFAKPGIRIADLGCGDATTIGDRVKDSGATYVGVDVSPSAVSAAVDRGLNVRLIEDVSSTGLESGSFHAVFLVEVLEHLLNPLAAVKEAQRLLRPGGHLLITCPNAALWTRRVELLLLGRTNAMGDELSRDEPWRDPHIRWFTLPSLEALLRTAGFDDIKVGGTECSFPIRSAATGLCRLRPTLFARRCTGDATKP